MKQKIVLISALAHNPKYLIMDEPFVGLDPKAVFDMKEILAKGFSELGLLAEEKQISQNAAKTYLYSSGLKIYSTQVTSIQTVMENEAN